MTYTYINVFDAVGSIFSFLSTICYIRISVLAWPLGLVAICIDIILYLKKGIYGDAGLQLIYMGMTFYGWWQWRHGGKSRTELPIAYLTYKNSLFLLFLFLFGAGGLSLSLKLHTDSQVPYWDAATTCLSLIAQWLTCRKIIQNWHLWFIVDALFAGMYFYKGIPLHASLQIFYLGLAVIGYLNWKKQARFYATEVLS